MLAEVTGESRTAMESRKQAAQRVTAFAMTGKKSPRRKHTFDRVYEVVRRIPRGRVLTYGRISNLIERRLSPLAVGWALHQCPETVPWHRVVNAAGGCSTRRDPTATPGYQQSLLEQEGIEFRSDGTLNLTRHLWHPSGGSVLSLRAPPR